MKIKSLLNEDVVKLLSEESLEKIENALERKVQLNVETALQQQDDMYAEKLETLVKTIDKDRTTKMQRIIESGDKRNTKMLTDLVEKYENSKITEAKDFKLEVVKGISEFLEEFLAESINTEDLAQAVKNKTAFNVLESMRKTLAVDTALINESVSGTIVNAKSKQDALEKENLELKKQFKALYEQNEKTNARLVLESKTSKLPEAKKTFLHKALGDKTTKFIEENFEYMGRLFDKQEKEKLQTLKEEAIQNRTVKPDVVPPQKVVKENINTNDGDSDPYITELSKQFGTRRGA